MNVVDSFARAVQMSVLTRSLAIVFSFCVLMCALGVATYETITAQPLNPFVISILGTGVGYALHAMGLNQGLTLTTMDESPTPTPTQTSPHAIIDPAITAKMPVVKVGP